MHKEKKYLVLLTKIKVCLKKPSGLSMITKQLFKSHLLTYGFSVYENNLRWFFKLADRMRSMRTNGAFKNRDYCYTNG